MANAIGSLGLMLWAPAAKPPVISYQLVSEAEMITPILLVFVVSADGYEPVTTHIFDRTDPYLASDAVFAVKDSLVCDFVRHEMPEPEASRLGIAPPFCTATFDFRLTPASSAQATVMDAQRRLAALGARG